MALTARNRPHRKWKRDEKLNRGQRRTRLRDGWRHSPRLGREPRARACWRALGQGRAARGSWGHTQAVLCHLGPQRRHSHCLGPPKVEQEGREAQLSSSSALVSPQLLPSPQPSGSHLARQPGTGGFLSYREQWEGREAIWEKQRAASPTSHSGWKKQEMGTHRESGSRTGPEPGPLSVSPGVGRTCERSKLRQVHRAGRQGERWAPPRSLHPPRPPCTEDKDPAPPL